MSEAWDPRRLRGDHELTVGDLHQLTASATPAFALELREGIRRLIAALPDASPVRVEGERAIERLTRLAFRADTPESFIVPSEQAWQPTGHPTSIKREGSHDRGCQPED